MFLQALVFSGFSLRLVGTKLVKAMEAKAEKDRRVPLTSWEVVIIRRPENVVKLPDCNSATSMAGGKVLACYIRHLLD